jgi:hypothetical protein
MNTNFLQVGRTIKCGHCGDFEVSEGTKCECICHDNQTLEDVLDECFPKGKCKERGQALVLYAYARQLLQSERAKMVEKIEAICQKKEQVNGYQPYGVMEGDQEPMQRKIFFDGFEDGRNMMKIDLLAIIKESL